MDNMQIEYDREVPLGQGGYGSVFPGKYNGLQVAVKTVQLHLVNDNEEKALQCLQQLGHPNIVKLFYSERNANFKFFALELCTASLDQLFLKPDHPRKYKGPALPPHLAVFLQLASGLKYIHSKKLFHRDIKPSNVLISVVPAKLVIMKWADFGLSKFVNERGTCTLSGIKGTLDYFAPELLRSLEKSEGPGRGTIKSDVFSFALVIGYLLLDGQHLYGSIYDVPGNILKKNQVNMDKIDRSHYARDLLTKMLEDDPNKRISSEEVVKELEAIKIEVVKKELRELCNNENVDLNQIQLLIQNGIDLNGKDNDGWNALHFLCGFNSSEKIVDAMRILIQNGIEVDGKTNKGTNALHLLCRNNSSEKLIDAIRFLIQNGIDVKEKSKYGMNALHCLCSNNSSEKLIDLIQLLIENGIDVNAKTNNGANALHYLCFYNSSEKIVEAIRFLIQNGIDVKEKSKYGMNALHCLCSNNSSEKLIDAIEFLIQNKIDVKEKTNKGTNALHLLCRFHSSDKLIDAIQFLIQNGIDVNGRDNNGWNALHWLCRHNSSEKLIDVIEFLIQNRIQSDENDVRLLCGENPYLRNTETIEKIIQLLNRHRPPIAN